MRKTASESQRTIGQTLREASERLRAGRVDNARLTAELLLGAAMGRDRVYLMTYPLAEVGREALEQFEEFIERRGGGEPTQYIIGKQEFYGRDFRVTPSVLIPRPETELLVEKALEKLKPGDRVADLGCGSGCIAVSLALERPGVEVVGVDISRAALRIAQENAANLDAHVEFVEGDLCHMLGDEKFDMIVSNPPYVPLRDLGGLQREVRFEPSRALFGGENGLDFYARLAHEASRPLRPGGWLLLELGFGALQAVEAMFGSLGWKSVGSSVDLAGIDRVLIARTALG